MVMGFKHLSIDLSCLKSAFFGFDMSASISIIINMGFETGLFFFVFCSFHFLYLMASRIFSLTFFPHCQRHIMYHILCPPVYNLFYYS